MDTEFLTFVFEKTRREGECRIWTGVLQSAGYGQLGRKRNRLVHRAVYEAAHGPIPKGMIVHHSCGRRACAEPTHLSLMKPGEHVGMHNLVRWNAFREAKG